jgi:hypothetical protein
MRQTQMREILRDVDIAGAITPIVHKHHLTLADTTELLTRLAVPRARSVAELVPVSD